MNIKDIFSANNLAIQEASYTCGPVSLLNVLQLKGDFSRTEKELAQLCDAKPGTGTSQPNLVKIAKTVGLEVVEAKAHATIEDIQRNIDDGNYVIVCYMHLYSGEGHYSIITEYDDEALFFRDCSYGFFRVRKMYFKKFWYGDDELPQWYMAVR